LTAGTGFLMKERAMAGYIRVALRGIGHLVIMLLLCGTMRADGAPSRSARPGDLGVTIFLLAKDGAVAAHEPLLARITLVNNTAEEFSVPHLSCLELCDSAGKVVAAIPRPKIQGDFMYGAFMLKPGEKKDFTWVISALSQFDKPGVYTLHVHWLMLQGGELVDLATGTAGIRALPFDEQRVTARCEELFEMMTHPGQKDAIEVGVCARALRAVRHDLALPYLDWMAREWHDREACYAIRQIGTPQAKTLLEALAKRQDAVGKAARDTREMTPAPTMADIGG
jgi:hypothetical protein